MDLTHLQGQEKQGQESIVLASPEQKGPASFSWTVVCGDAPRQPLARVLLGQRPDGPLVRLGWTSTGSPQ